MSGLENIGKLLVFMGAAILVLGGILMVVGRFTNLGRLPGDIFVQRDGFTFSFPVVTMILLSIILTVILNLILRLWNR